MRIVFDNPNSEPTYLAGAHHIEEMIKSGQLKYGESLPSIREFSEDNGISTTTAQRIYSLIEQKGLINTIQGSGSQVSYCTEPDYNEDVNRVSIFWSYAHKDEENSRGAVLELLESIKAEYELQTGDELEVFVDKDAIEWGSNWKDAINEAIMNTVIFIPVLTPTYLKRPSCLGELRNAVSVIREEKAFYGLLPIRFINIDNALRTFPDDDLANTLQDTQAENFYELNTRDPDSKEYREYVTRLVSKIITLDQSLCENSSDRIERNADAMKNDIQDGFLDRLAKLEFEGENQAKILDNMTQVMEAIGQLAQSKTAEIESADANHKGFSAKLLITRDMAKELNPLAEKFYAHCREFTQSVDNMGSGIDAYIDICRYYGGERSEEFESGIHCLIRNTAQAFDNCESFGKAVSIIGKMSRDLRGPANIIQKSLDLFCSTQCQFRKWNEGLNAINRTI